MIWRKLDTVETNCTIFYDTSKLKICCNRLIKTNYSNPSRSNSEAVHLREEWIVLILSGRVIFLLKSYFLRKTMIKIKPFNVEQKL